MAAISACSSDSSECGSSSSSVVSLLDRLKSPTPADIGRARKLKTNPPPVGKRHCKGGVTSDPKRVEPKKHVQVFPNEMLKTSTGKLFCEACQEELGLKKCFV